MNKTVKELLVLHFLNDGVRSTFMIMLPFIAKDLNFNLSVVGFLGSTQPLIAAFLALPAGFFAVKLGGFHLLSALLVVYSLGALGISLSPNMLFLILAFFLGALGFGMFHTIGFSLIAKSSSETKIGRNMGDFTSIGDIGRVMIPPVAVFLVTIFGWRVTMFAISVLGFLLYFLIRIFKSAKESESANQKQLPKETSHDFIKSLLQLIKGKKIILVLLASIIDAFASSPIYIFLPFLLITKGIQVTEYAVAMGAFFLGSIFGRTVIGRGVDKFGNSKIFILAEILMAAVLILLTLSSGFIILLGLSFLLGTFTRGTSPAVQTMFSQTVHKMHYDKIYALGEMFIAIAATITLIMMGLIANSAGIYFVFYFASVLALLATIPALILLKLRE